MTDEAAPRRNRDGDACPPWCVTDHGEEPIPGEFQAAHSSEIVHTAGRSSISAVLFPHGHNAEVQVCTPGRGGGSLFLSAHWAGYLAILIEELAGAAPEEHHELAAAIRQAAAVITGAGEPQP